MVGRCGSLYGSGKLDCRRDDLVVECFHTCMAFAYHRENMAQKLERFFGELSFGFLELNRVQWYLCQRGKSLRSPSPYGHGFW